MNDSSYHVQDAGTAADISPILLVPYQWIGDFVRCHSVVKLLRQRFPHRPVDMLASTLCAPLTDYMPGLRKAVVADLPRRSLGLGRQQELGRRLRQEGWKAALAPYLAGIPARTGFVGEARFVLLNDLRWGEKKLPRMIDRCGALALPPGAEIPADWPLPELKVSPEQIRAWRQNRGLEAEHRPVVALAPGAVGPSKRWPKESYAALTRKLLADGFAVWILGGPGEKALATDIAGGTQARDLTGTDLRDAILALAGAAAAVSNDSGLLHVAAALGTPSLGIFGPTSPWHWAPLNPLAATIETASELPCRPCHKPVCRLRHHRCMNDIAPGQVIAAVENVLKTVLAEKGLVAKDLGQPA
jgi:heptosyltransferase-2